MKLLVNRYLLWIALLFATVFIVVISRILDPLLALLGSYLIIGISIAIFVNKFSSRGSLHEAGGGQINSMKKLIVVLLLSTSIMFYTHSRLLPLLVGVPLTYYYILRQIDLDHSESGIVFSVVLVFVFIAFSRYITTGFFFGSTDTFIYVREIENLIDAGQLAILQRKEEYPLYHVLIASVSESTGLAVYESLVFTGVSLFAVTCVVIYSLARTLSTNRQAAIAVMIGFSLIPMLFYYSLYLIPLSLGVVFLTILLFLSLQLSNSGSMTSRRISVLVVILVTGAVFTHHQSILLFLILVLAVAFVNRIIFSSRLPTVSSNVVLLLVVSASGYWALVEKQFIVGVFVIGGHRVNSLLTNIHTNSTSTNSQYVLGELAFQSDTYSRLLWYITPDGVFQIILVTFISLSVIAVYNEYERIGKFTHFYLVGFLSSILILRTVFSIPGITRFQLISAPVFGFVVGASLYGFFIRNGNKVSKRTVLALILLLSICSPLTVASDIDGVRPDVTDPPKNSLDTSEYTGIEMATDITGAEYPVSSLHVEERALHRYGVTTHSPMIDSDGLYIEEGGLFLYREDWTEHRATYRPPNSAANEFVYVSDTWLERSIMRENKIFTTGRVGLTWSEDPYYINETCNNCTNE